MKTNEETSESNYCEGYLCPHCGRENRLFILNNPIIEEKLVDCKHCHTTINLTTAYNPIGKLNIIAFEHDTDSFESISI